MDDLENVTLDFEDTGQNHIPERALWCAVIQRAHDDLTYYFDPNTAVTVECYVAAKRARNWLLSNNTQMLSFIWCVNVVFGCYGSSLEQSVIDKLRRLSLRPIISPNQA
jgi:hypothetical protein